MDRKKKEPSDHSPSAQQPLRPVAVAGAKLDWPERLSVVALIIAAIALLVYGGVLSALFLALAALMGWTRQHRLQAAQGKRSFSDFGRFITGAFMVVIAVALWPRQEAAVPSQKEVAPAAHIEEAKRGSKCADDGIVTQTDFGVVADSETTFVSEPRTGASPVMMNVGGTRLPVPLEGDATVREICRAGKWSQVRVLTSSQDHGPLKGWVPTSALRKVPTSASGRRIYQSADFEWPDGSLPHRSAAVKIMKQHHGAAT